MPGSTVWASTAQWITLVEVQGLTDTHRPHKLNRFPCMWFPLIRTSPGPGSYVLIFSSLWSFLLFPPLYILLWILFCASMDINAYLLQRASGRRQSRWKFFLPVGLVFRQIGTLTQLTAWVNRASTRQSMETCGHSNLRFLWKFCLGSKLAISSQENFLVIEKEERCCQHINNLNNLKNWSLRPGNNASSLCSVTHPAKCRLNWRSCTESIKCTKQTFSFHCYQYFLMPGKYSIELSTMKMLHHLLLPHIALGYT